MMMTDAMEMTLRMMTTIHSTSLATLFSTITLLFALDVLRHHSAHLALRLSAVEYSIVVQENNRWIASDIPVCTVHGRKCLFRVKRMTSMIDPLPLQEESLKHLSRRGGEIQWEAHDDAGQRCRDQVDKKKRPQDIFPDSYWLPVRWPLD
jgi:hypothetical protein